MSDTPESSFHIATTDKPLGENLPSVYVNGVAITMNDMARLVFTETLDKHVHPRGAIIMTRENARSIANFILHTDEQHQDRLRAEAAAKANAEGKTP